MPPGLHVDRLQKLEWISVALAAIIAYWLTGASWWLFIVLLLVPDLSMIGYLAGNRIGAIAYNLAHILVWPTGFIIWGLLGPDDLLLSLGLIWLVHIALDRALGYGLKLPTGFRHTHLGQIGR